MASMALFLWPLIGVLIFVYLGPTRGLIWTTMVGYLFLPEAFEIDIPALPPYDKFAAITVSLLLGLFATRDRLVDEQAPTVQGDPLLRALLVICVVLLIASPILTMLTNPEALINGPRVRPALTWRDATSVLIETLILFTPFFLAWRYLSQPDLIREMLLALIFLGFAYSFLILFESRMSPQLHRWVYGYFQHSWIQHIRGGEFRPIVFLRHGLWLGFFAMSVVLAAFAVSRPTVKRAGQPAAHSVGRENPVDFETSEEQEEGRRYFSDWEITRKLIPLSPDRFQRTLRQHPGLPQGITQSGIKWFSEDDLARLRAHFASEGVDIPNARIETFRDRLPYLLIGVWTLGVLLLSRNLGATLLAMMFSTMIFFSPQRIQLRVCMIVAILFLAYPAMKYYGSAPTERILEFAERISEERAQSFAFRLRHEDALIGRALEKPLFGWGGWARAQHFDELGRHITTNDGIWIITLGERGLVGYCAFFGLLALPLFFLRRARNRKDIPPTVMAIVMISTANFVYMIPNSTLSPIGLLLFGALAAFAQRDVTTYDAGAPDILSKPVRRAPDPYTRFPGGPVLDHAVTRGKTARPVDPSVSAYRHRTPPKGV